MVFKLRSFEEFVNEAMSPDEKQARKKENRLIRRKAKKMGISPDVVRRMITKGDLVIPGLDPTAGEKRKPSGASRDTGFADTSGPDKIVQKVMPRVPVATHGLMYADDDIVDVRKIKIATEFHELNRILFKKKLKPVPFKWSKRKRSHGHVQSMRNRFTQEVVIKHLAMSEFFKMTWQHFKNTLAHEMIHVKNIQDGDRSTMSNGHGPGFIKEMNRINGLGLGFNVQIRSDRGYQEISDTVKMKKPIYIGLTELRGKKAMILMSEKAYMRQRSNLESNLSGMATASKPVIVKYVKSWDSGLKRYKISQSFARRVSWNTPDDELYNKLSKEQEVNTVTIKPKTGDLSWH